MSGFVASAIAFVVAIGVLISVHEFGHFWVARRLGVKVVRFSIGFGKPLWSRVAGVDRTEYVVAAIPLGGYVKFVDEREGEVEAADLPRAFNRQRLGVRTAIVAAGPIFNLVFAVAAYWLLFVSGIEGLRPVVGEVEPGSVVAEAGLRPGDEITAVQGRATATWEAASDELVLRIADGHRYLDGGQLLEKLGLRPWQPTVPALIDQVLPGSPAEQAGMQAGDRVVAAAGEPMADWRAWVEFVRARPGETFDVEVARDGARLTLMLTPERIAGEGGSARGRIGAQARLPADVFEGMRAEHRYGPVEAVGEAVRKSWNMATLMLTMLGKMVIGEASLDNISGPISIAEYAGRTASIGLTPFLSFLALISISLGVLNLLPIPLLDGGHLMYYLIELVKGSPVTEAFEIAAQRVGIALLFLLMGLAFYNDLARLLGG
jgi:regulator of sigma E protease